MGHLKTTSRIHLASSNALKKCLLALATCGLVLSSASAGAGIAQSNASPDRLLSKQASASATRAVLADGVYLFGQTETPNELGMAYTVFSVSRNQAVGAVYQPRSSFDCFSGQISPDKLAMNIVDSYDQTAYSYEIAVSLDNSLVAGNAAGAYSLDGFHRIDELSGKDLEMLAVCQADLAE